MFVYDALATKILNFGTFRPGTYEAFKLNSLIFSLPFAEAHIIAENRVVSDLPRLGETLSLPEHLQSTVLPMLGDDDLSLINMTSPVLIQKAFLARLDDWIEWQVVQKMLAKHEVAPI